MAYHIAIVENDFDLPFERFAFGTTWAKASRVHAVVILGRDSLLVVTRPQNALPSTTSMLTNNTCLLDASSHYLACLYH
eukprot:1501722-Amphidinium_carterae.1